MQLKDIMTPGVEVIASEASIYEAAEKMSHRDIGPLPVCEGERLVGMLTDRDITVRAVAAGRDPRMTHVRDIMTPDVVYGFEDQEVEDAARLMEQYQIRRLPVLVVSLLFGTGFSRILGDRRLKRKVRDGTRSTMLSQ